MKDANKEKLSHLLHLLVWYWSVFVRVVADITLVCPLYLLMTFFALIARQIRVFLEMRKYVSNLLPHLKHSRGTLQLCTISTSGNSPRTCFGKHSRTLSVSTFTNSLCLYNQYLRGFPSNVYWEISICVLSIITCISEAFFRLYRRISDEKFFFSLENTLSPVSHSVLAFLPSPWGLKISSPVSRQCQPSPISHLGDV